MSAYLTDNVDIIGAFYRIACDGWSTVDTAVKVHAPGPLLPKSELRSCVKVEVAVLGLPSLISLWFLWT